VEVSGSEVVTMKDHAEYDPSVKLLPSLLRTGIGQIIQHPIGFCFVVIESTILIVYIQFYCLDCKSWIACAVFCGNECHLEYFSNGLKQIQLEKTYGLSYLAFTVHLRALIDDSLRNYEHMLNFMSTSGMTNVRKQSDIPQAYSAIFPQINYHHMDLLASFIGMICTLFYSTIVDLSTLYHILCYFLGIIIYALRFFNTIISVSLQDGKYLQRTPRSGIKTGRGQQGYQWSDSQDNNWRRNRGRRPYGSDIGRGSFGFKNVVYQQQEVPQGGLFSGGFNGEAAVARPYRGSAVTEIIISLQHRTVLDQSPDDHHDDDDEHVF